MDQITYVHRFEERHLVHGRGDRRAARVPLRHGTGDVVDQLHDHSAVDGAEQVRVERRHDPGK
jgi:hypothetical protein